MKEYFFVVCLVLIGFSGTAYGQYSGDKVPPKTMYDVETGETIFPPFYIDFYYSDSRFEKYSVIAEQYRYDIPYMVSNGTISQMDLDCSSVELVLDVKPSGKQGWITLALPRQLIDSKTGDGKDDIFIVFQDSKEIQPSDIASEKLRLLIIPFSDDASQVNIIGVNYPEQMGENACNGMHDPPISYLFSPLKQSQMGMPYNEITCMDDLVLVQKYDNSPACIKTESIPKLIDRGWITGPTNSDIHTIKYSPVLFKGTGISTNYDDDDEFTLDEFQRLQQRAIELDALLEDRSISEKIREGLYDEGDVIRHYSQQAFDEGVPFETIVLLWEKRSQLDEELSEQTRTERFPIACTGSISVGFHAYSLDEIYAGNPTALTVEIAPEHFTKTNLQDADQIVRKYVGDEIDVIYSKSDCYAIAIEG